MSGQDNNNSPNDGPAERQQSMVVSGWKKLLHLILAGFFLLLGILGALLPVLPTTPFLLLTSFFLVRSSPRLNEALLKSRFFGPILTDWQRHGGVRPNVKAQAVTVVVLVVGATLYFSELPNWGSGTVSALALIGITVILRLPTAREL